MSVAGVTVAPSARPPACRAGGVGGTADPEAESVMIEGTVIAESLRVGADVEFPGLTVRKISRFRVQDGVPDQPDIWTTLVFEADDADAGGLAEPIAGVLGPSGWYVDFRSAEETFVVFPDLVFRYRRGDQAARAQAQAHGRLALPEPQLDWPV